MLVWAAMMMALMMAMHKIRIPMRMSMLRVRRMLVLVSVMLSWWCILVGRVMAGMLMLRLSNLSMRMMVTTMRWW